MGGRSAAQAGWLEAGSLAGDADGTWPTPLWEMADEGDNLGDLLGEAGKRLIEDYVLCTWDVWTGKTGSLQGYLQTEGAGVLGGRMGAMTRDSKLAGKAAAGDKYTNAIRTRTRNLNGTSLLVRGRGTRATARCGGVELLVAGLGAARHIQARYRPEVSCTSLPDPRQPTSVKNTVRVTGCLYVTMGLKRLGPSSSTVDAAGVTLGILTTDEQRWPLPC